MDHLFASIVFSLIALGAFALIAATLIDAREDVLLALGIVTPFPMRRERFGAIRVRSTGRWPGSVPAMAREAIRAAA